MKAVNLLERETGTIHSEDSVEIWSLLCVMIWRALKPVEGTLGYDAFRAWYLIPREDKVVAKASKDDLAKHLGVSPRTLSRHLNKTLDRVERELMDVGLIPPPFIAV
jgi:DNA-binding transcriptional ArsR family regulator